MDKSLSRLTHINLASGFRGGERQTLLLMDALSKRGFNQTLICRKNSDLQKKAERIKNLEINVTGLNTIACIRYFFNEGTLHFHESRAFFAFWLSSLFLRKKSVREKK